MKRKLTLFTKTIQLCVIQYSYIAPNAKIVISMQVLAWSVSLLSLQLKLLPDSISSNIIFKIFLEAHAPRRLQQSMLCKLNVFHILQEGPCINYVQGQLGPPNFSWFLFDPSSKCPPLKVVWIRPWGMLPEQEHGLHVECALLQWQIKNLKLLPTRALGGP